MIDLLVSRDPSSGQAIAHPGSRTSGVVWPVPQSGSADDGPAAAGPGEEEPSGRRGGGTGSRRTPVGVRFACPARTGLFLSPPFFLRGLLRGLLLSLRRGL